MEDLVTAAADSGVGIHHDDPFGGAYAGKRVFVTGHTGFKGSWLTLWLERLGANVVGYSLTPPTEPSLFDQAEVGAGIRSLIEDVRDARTLHTAIAAAEPEIIFHLAAQPLVRASYADPRGTFETNVMGTVNVLDAARLTPSVRAVVNVTSDKSYENQETGRAYRETDPMGGHDPYSASKGAAEIVATAYRRSFFSEPGCALVASCRAGNVIGGGDWAPDRIVPDCVRALAAGEPIEVRNPRAVRPWQHVLEPLGGYLLVGAKLLAGERVDEGWNFGPGAAGDLPVGDLATRIVELWGSGTWIDRSDPDAVHEATLLHLDIAKAATRLGWTPQLGMADTLSWTVDWYRAQTQTDFTAREYTLAQIDQYATRAAAQQWAAAPAMETTR